MINEEVIKEKLVNEVIEEPNFIGPQCCFCRKNTHRRIVQKKFELIDISNELPKKLHGIIKEYKCKNIVFKMGKGNKWREEICEGNAVIVLDEEKLIKMLFGENHE